MIFIYRYKKDNDIYFLSGTEDNKAIISHTKYRFSLTVSQSEIEELSKEFVQTYNVEQMENRYKLLKNLKKDTKYLYGKILHIDGDRNYLNECIKLYNEASVVVKGIYLNPQDIASRIIPLIDQYRPSIVVLTGHDDFNDKNINNLDNYKYSNDYVRAIVKIREYYSLSDLIIISGACKSNFEALIASGANIASSPDRINIHLYDPAIYAIKLATTHVSSYLNYSKIKELLISGLEGMSGIDTSGTMRIIYR